MPRLLQVIDNLTNWYIRFNRKRLKGTAGLSLEDTTAALNTLFEVLFTIIRAMAPFTPFITEHIYGLLKPYLGDYVTGLKNPASVHFLPFPTVREELVDVVIERKICAMQKVIRLARTARERRGINLKVPLKSLVVIGNPDFISDIDTLRLYVTEELNVKEVILTDDEEKYNIILEARVDWPTLGKRLKKDVQVVRNALPGLTQEELRQYQREQQLIVGGIHLAGNDLTLARMMPTSNLDPTVEVGPSWEPFFDEDVVVLLDCASHPELEDDGLARDIITRVQKLRKKAGLVPLDLVRMQYMIVSNPEEIDVDALISLRQSLFMSTLRGQLEELSASGVEEGGGLIEEEQSLGALTLRFRLTRI